MNISDDYLISSDIASEMNERQEVEALTKLLQYQFSKVKELGAPIGRYNGAKRVDITQLDKYW